MQNKNAEQMQLAALVGHTLVAVTHAPPPLLCRETEAQGASLYKAMGFSFGTQTPSHQEGEADCIDYLGCLPCCCNCPHQLGLSGGQCECIQSPKLTGY